MRFLSLALLLACSCRATAPKATRWENAMQHGTAAFERGRYREALKSFNSAVRRAGSGPRDSLRRAEALAALADTHLELLEYTKAERFALEVLDLRKKSLQARDPLIASSLNLLGSVYFQQEHYELALRYFEQAIAHLEKTASHDAPAMASLLNNLAMTHRALGGDYPGHAGKGVNRSRDEHWPEAERLYRRSIQLDPDGAGTTLGNLAELYRAMGRHAESADLYRRALDMETQRLGPKHPHIAVLLSNLGLVHVARQQWAEAESLFKQALALRHDNRTPEHREAETALNLARLYRRTSRNDLAERFFQRAIEAEKASRSSSDTDLASFYREAAEFFVSTGRFMKAEKAYRRAITIVRDARGPADPELSQLLKELDELTRRVRGETPPSTPLSSR